MACQACIHALEQGAFALYELITFRPELLPSPPPDDSPKAIAEWLIGCASAVRMTADSP